MDICCHTEHITTYRDIGRLDPTRTTTLRNAFVRDVNKRFNELKRMIRYAIVDLNVFGEMVTQQITPPLPRQFNFPRSGDKIEAFMTWLRRQEERGLLQTITLPQIGAGVEGAWTNIYIYDSYKRGVLRARYEMSGLGIPPIDETGGIMATMSTPFHADRVGLLFTRTFEGLKGITTAMDTQISRVLAQGMADGDNPRLLARKLLSTIDGTGMGDLAITDTLGRFIPAQRRAQTLARTEIIRAHHQANIQEYRNWAVEGVKVQVEWRTAGFDVCDICKPLQGRVFTLDQIQGMIPVHPNCRCIAIPVREEKK